MLGAERCGSGSRVDRLGRRPEAAKTGGLGTATQHDGSLGFPHPLRAAAITGVRGRSERWSLPGVPGSHEYRARIETRASVTSAGSSCGSTPRFHRADEARVPMYAISSESSFGELT